MKTLDTSRYKIIDRISLADVSTISALQNTDDEIQEMLHETREILSRLQESLYAQGRYSVLIILQGMDTSGKDSLVREVFKEFNVRGVTVHSFKKPSEAELKHDFLWRHYVALPQRGKFGIFNRSHYENVLVSRVHPEIILQENLPGITSVDDIPDDFWQMRFRQINDFEKHLTENGTIVLKLFLHLSKREQARRLLRRIDKAKHNWKFSPGDLIERESWDQYQEYYEDAINQTSVPSAPWYVIPADDKGSARLIAARIILEELRKYPIAEPELDPEVKSQLTHYRQILEKE